MSEQPTARLIPPYPGLPPRWIVCPTNRVWLEPFWRFRRRIDAIAFAARKGIRLVTE